MAISRGPIIVERRPEFIRFITLSGSFSCLWPRIPLLQIQLPRNVRRKNVFAALLVMIGMTMISSNDSIMKLSGAEMSVGQMLFVRGFFAVILFSIYIKITGRPLLPRLALNRWSWARAACECAATVCFITSLTLLPIAIASTLVWITPLLLTIAAAVILKEQVSIRRWLAVVVGFGGVLLVTNPFGESFSLAMLLPLCSAVFVSMRDLCTRKVDAKLDSLHVLLVTLFIVTIVGYLMTWNDWRDVSIPRASWLALAAVLLGTGFLLQIKAVRMGELSFIAPFSYTGILVAVFWGFAIWNELPSIYAFAGMGLIVGSGIYLLRGPRKQD